MALAGNSGFLENRITQQFGNLRHQKRKGLITYITAGDPDLETTVKLVLEIAAAGADVIELGVPYSDPLADGPIIQQASLRALQKGTNLPKIFRAVRQIRLESQIPLVLMTYYNPVFKYGLHEVAREAAEAGVDGLIVPDLPMEESAPFQTILNKQGLFLIPLVAPTSGSDRIAALTRVPQGFVYCVSVTGVTGVREDMPEGLEVFLNTARDLTDSPLAVGFGVSTPEQARDIVKHCDAVIVGSALVKTIEEHQKSPFLLDRVKEFIQNLRSAI